MSLAQAHQAAAQNQPRQKASIIVFAEDNYQGHPRIYLIERVGKNGDRWFDFAGGTMEDGESAQACAQRELEEECSIIVDQSQIGDTGKSHYTPPNEIYPHGLNTQFYMVEKESCIGQAAINKEGLEAGHVSVRPYSIPNALKLLDASRLGPEIINLLSDIYDASIHNMAHNARMIAAVREGKIHPVIT